jgi:Holliday junction resolvasome RuvABC endonuclease subunit
MKVKSFGTPPSTQVSIGIDQSYGGFAITLLGNTHYSVVATVPPTSAKGVKRLIELREFLSDTLQGYTIKDIAMEGYAYSATMGHTMGELGGMVKVHLYETYGIAPTLVPPATLKKYITGKGTGVQKNQILLNVYKKWGVEFTDDNAADSYGLARIAAGIADVAYEKEVLKTLSDPKFRGI